MPSSFFAGSDLFYMSVNFDTGSDVVFYTSIEVVGTTV